jgi:hypothetical protein
MDGSWRLGDAVAPTGEDWVRVTTPSPPRMHGHVRTLPRNMRTRAVCLIHEPAPAYVLFTSLLANGSYAMNLMEARGLQMEVLKCACA